MAAEAVAIAPRLLDREGAAAYLGTSTDTIDRLIQADQISVVRLPVERQRRTSKGVPGISRRILIDRVELDALIEKWKERNPKNDASPRAGQGDTSSIAAALQARQHDHPTTPPARRAS